MQRTSLAGELDKNELGYIFGQLPFACQSQTGGKNQVDVPIDKLRKSSLRPALRVLPQEFKVFHFLMEHRRTAVKSAKDFLQDKFGLP